MADLIDLQKELGIKPGEMSAVASRLHVLRFDWDKKGVNVVSSLDHVIVFVSPHYNGDQPEIGDVWLCSVEPHSSVFWAYPLMRITSSFLMGLSDGMREEIYDSLWATNRKEFEKEFEKRYRESAMVAAREQLEKSHRAEIAGMQARIEALKTENEQNRILLQSRSSHADDEIILTSERQDDGEAPAQAAKRPEAEIPVPSIAMTDQTGRPVQPQYAAHVPHQEAVQHQKAQFHVYRADEGSIFSESFTDDRYFVHMSPNMKYMVIRPNEFGDVICVDRHIRLSGLNVHFPFTERRELVSEYSTRYGGLLVHMQ